LDNGLSPFFHEFFSPSIKVIFVQFYLNVSHNLNRSTTMSTEKNQYVKQIEVKTMQNKLEKAIFFFELQMITEREKSFFFIDGK
jgi:hypothetical protein